MGNYVNDEGRITRDVTWKMKNQLPGGSGRNWFLTDKVIVQGMQIQQFEMFCDKMRSNNIQLTEKQNRSKSVMFDLKYLTNYSVEKYYVEYSSDDKSPQNSSIELIRLDKGSCVNPDLVQLIVDSCGPGLHGCKILTYI